MPGQIVEFATNGSTNRGYVSVPPHGLGWGVVVLQEWWGLVPHIQDVCDRMAEDGFVAYAPDLYHGKTTASPDEAGKLMMALEIDQAERDFASAVQYVLSHEKTSTHAVGVVGFCMGGQLALYAASKNADIAACVDFYGIHPSVEPDYANIKCPVTGFFAEKDEFVNPAAVAALAAKLEAAGVSHDFKTYPGTQHAFFNDTRPEVYDADAAADAWDLALEFFRDELS